MLHYGSAILSHTTYDDDSTAISVRSCDR